MIPAPSLAETTLMLGPRRTWPRYGVAVASIALATIARLLLDPILGDRAPFLAYFFAMMVVAWYGWGPSLLALALTCMAVAFLFLPTPDATPGNGRTLIGLVIFLLMGLLIARLGASQFNARRRAEAKAEEASERREWLRITLASIGDAVVATDDSGRVSFLNPVAESLTGWAEREAVGRPLEDIFRIVNEETRLPVESPVDRVLREGIVVGLANHTVLIARDGTERGIDDSAAPIRNADGNLIGVVLIFRDVTERRRAEAERADLLRRERDARQEAEAASRAKDQFLAMLSHELRTPLTPVLMTAAALARDPETPPGLVPVFEMIRQNVELEARLIDDLLDVMSILRGKMPFRWEIVDAHTLIRRTSDICRGEWSAKRIDLEADLAATEHHLEADPARLQQVLWNLYRNAIKFTPEGGRITVSTRDEGGRLIIEVADTGLGIDADALPRIFNAFEQAEDPRTRSFGGLGLGLAISRTIAEAHGGTLTAASPGKDRGATFTLELAPVPPPTGDEDRAPEPRAEEATGPGELHILLVEDDPMTSRVMARLLRQHGYTVATAHSIAGALEVLDGETDLVVSDIGLPDGSGFDLMRTIRKSRDIPGIALTGFGMADDIARGREAGFTAHLTKPVDFRMLDEAIRRAAGPAGG